MTYPTAIVLAAALIAGAVLLSNNMSKVGASSGDWRPIGAVGYTAWVLNENSGTMKICVSARRARELLCWQEQMPGAIPPDAGPGAE